MDKPEQVRFEKIEVSNGFELHSCRFFLGGMISPAIHNQLTEFRNSVIIGLHFALLVCFLKIQSLVVIRIFKRSVLDLNDA